MSSDQAKTPGAELPVLLLKTKSTPTDAYEDLLNQQTIANHRFKPRFVPVLRHSLKEDGMSRVNDVLRDRGVNNTPEAAYGGMIFTSQRSVEAFAGLVEKGKGDPAWPHLQGVPIYSVGPATSRALRAIPQNPPLEVFGEHSGTGEVLSQFILEHYREWYKDRPVLPPLLFLVGEVRSDVLPKRLMAETLPADRRIGLTEVEVYETGVMESFPVDLQRVLQESLSASRIWVVVFSPAGCENMLKGIGFLDSEGRATGRSASRVLVATIGPTTRDCLLGYGFTPHVCAEQPSPEGVLNGIVRYMSTTNQ